MPHDDFAVEPIKGLPGVLPEGEDILWQGHPNWWALSKDSLNMYWIFTYFLILALWRFASLYDLTGTGHALALALPLVIAGLVACTILALIAFIQARCTIYTITTKRVVLRIGAAFSVAINLPYSKLSNATLGLRKDGTGTIALELSEPRKFSFFVLWPHARPWRFTHPEPALRSIENAKEVALILSEAAKTEVNAPKISKTTNAIVVAE
mgnify:CR=1 FL=1